MATQQTLNLNTLHISCSWDSLNCSVEVAHKAPKFPSKPPLPPFHPVDYIALYSTQCRASLSYIVSFFVPFALISDPSVDVSGPSHLASDSDSEVYCDSVDQFGQEEASNNVKITYIARLLKLLAHY